MVETLKVNIGMTITIPKKSLNHGLIKSPRLETKQKFLECILTIIMAVNALQFKEMTGTELSENETRAVEHAETYFSKQLQQQKLD